jgi:hypothetical protein
MASRQSPRGLTFTARGRQIFKGFKISAGPQHFVYNFLSVWTIGGREDVGLYRKPFSLGRKSSARGRSIARSQKFFKKFFSCEPLKPEVFGGGEFIEGINLYAMALRDSPRLLTLPARGRQIFKSFKFRQGPQ